MIQPTNTTVITGVCNYHYYADNSEVSSATIKLVSTTEPYVELDPWSVFTSYVFPNGNWYAFPDEEIPAGTYMIADSIDYMRKICHRETL